MWELKKEAVKSPDGVVVHRHWLENESGAKLIWRGFMGPIDEGANERFTYERAGLSLSLIASRFDDSSRSIGGHYVVWLGTALQHRDDISVDQVREIAIDVRDALLTWRLPGKIPEQLGCDPAARSVSFHMKTWSKWNSGLEKGWP